MSRVVIAGGREINDPALVERAVAESGFKITEVVCGDARGVDTLGRLWAEQRGIPVRRMPAAWQKYGKRAGFLRNASMAEVGEALILVWSGRSPGSQNMLVEAAKRGLKIHQLVVRDEGDDERPS